MGDWGRKTVCGGRGENAWAKGRRRAGVGELLCYMIVRLVGDMFYTRSCSCS